MFRTSYILLVLETQAMVLTSRNSYSIAMSWFPSTVILLYNALSLHPKYHREKNCSVSRQQLITSNDPKTDRQSHLFSLRSSDDNVAAADGLLRAHDPNFPDFEPAIESRCGKSG